MHFTGWIHSTPSWWPTWDHWPYFPDINISNPAAWRYKAPYDVLTVTKGWNNYFDLCGPGIYNTEVTINYPIIFQPEFKSTSTINISSIVDHNLTIMASEINFNPGFELVDGIEFDAIANLSVRCNNGKKSYINQPIGDYVFYNQDSLREAYTKQQKELLDSVLLVENISTSVIKDSLSISIFPNPNNGIFTIGSNVNIESIVIYDLLGKIIYEDNNFLQKNNKLLLSELTIGTYIIKIVSFNYITTKTLIIK